MEHAPLSIVIAGGGTAGWMAAALLSRMLGPGARIALVESEAIGTVGVGEATIPQIHLFNQALGIDEASFVRETQATFKLGIEFDGWTSPQSTYMHAFGVVGRAAGVIPFRQLWHRANADGRARPYGDYSVNEVAARAGRMARGDGSDGVSDLVYAYHFDASLYTGYLRRHAEARGVVRHEGMIERVDRDPETGDITALQIDGGRSLAGDLFIDCTGVRSLLIGGALGVGFRDWSNVLPCDRAMAVACERSDAFRPFTQSMARTAGWQWRIPLQQRTGNGHVYCSSVMSDDEAAAILLSGLDGAAIGEPRPLRFKAGRREAAWSHNCVALGLAAGFMEPLESTSIHLVQSSLARLVKYLPGGRISPTARDSFNRQFATEWEQVRDFLVFHYRANGRVGEPFWDRCRAMDIPTSLADRIAMFEEAAVIVREDGELFTEEGWGQVMIGQGLEPRTISPMTAAIPGDELDNYLTTLAKGQQQRAATLPTHAALVAAIAGDGQAAEMVR